MTSDSYGVEDYVADIRAIVAEETEQRRITERIRPLAKRLAAEPGWFKDEYRTTDPDQGFGVHLLSEEENHDTAVFVIAWAPNRGTKPHNHLTWAVVVGLEGEEHEVNFQRLDDGSKPGFADLKACGEATLYPGSTSVCMPHDIHRVWNTGESVSISLHTYGRHLNHTGRSEFDVAAKREQPFIVKVED